MSEIDHQALALQLLKDKSFQGNVMREKVLGIYNQMIQKMMPLTKKQKDLITKTHYTQYRHQAKLIDPFDSLEVEE